MTQTLSGLDRLTVEKGKLGGQPCIRGYRLSAHMVLEMLSGGYTPEQIIADFPFVEPEDIQQVLAYAARLADVDVVSQTA